MTSYAALPPPLPRRRTPPATALRATLWRWRFLVVAICLAVVAQSTVDALRPAPPPHVRVAVVARALPAGTRLRTDDLRMAELPASVAPDQVVRARSTLVGAVTAVPLTAGTPLVPGLLVPDDLAGPPGTVVAAVRLADPAAASLLGAGMRVDVLAATPDGERGAVVASRALVLPAPVQRERNPGPLSAPADNESLPVLLAVAPDEVDELAAASASALLSAVVVP
ncbi:MAG: SAF domain-containing protein [Brevundimonas sp.]